MRAGKHFSPQKGHTFNKMHCLGQKLYFDSEDPSMLLIPCLPFDKVMNWASNKETATEYNCLVMTFGEKKRRAAETVLKRVPGECSKEGIHDARELLTKFIKGVAGSLKDSDVLESFKEKEFKNSCIKIFLNFSKLFSVAKLQKSIREICKATFKKVVLV